MTLLLFPLLGGIFRASAQDAPPPPPPPPATQIFPGLMNPSISANGLFLAGAQWNDGELAPPLWAAGEEEAPPAGGETFGTGLAVQEVEVQLKSAVDPYFDANLVFAIPGVEGLEIEEGYVTWKSLPRVLVNVGKLKEPFGRENLTHTHALLTVDRALISQRVFGEEGLNDVAANAQVLLPTPWFAELTVGVDAGANDVVLGAGEAAGVGTMAHLRNLFDLGPTWTLELGASGLTGLAGAGGRSVVSGVDLTVKGHGRGRGQFRRLVWQNEVIFFDRYDGGHAESVSGLYSTLEGSFSRRVWLGGRFDLVGLTPDPAAPDAGRTLGATAIAVFAPTEFSALRLQGQRQFLPDGHTVDSVVGQLNFTIGAHPAHAY